MVAAVLSGNRNFEGRIHPLVRASYLASPPLVVAFALAGRVDIDLTTEPLGQRPGWRSRVSWPTSGRAARRSARPSARPSRRSSSAPRTPACSRVTSDGAACRCPPATATPGTRTSSYIALPPFFEGLTAEPDAITDIVGARVLAVLGDSVTTDHISPAGSIPLEPRRRVAPGAGRHALRLQQLRRPPRPSRGDDARHLRQHPAAERARLQGRSVHDLPARRRGDVPVRRLDALPGGRRAAGHPGGPGVRQRQLAATGRPRAPACWVSAPSSPRATSASIAPTSWAWVSCRSSSCPARASPRWG